VSGQVLGLIISGMSLLFVIVLALIGLIWRTGRSVGSTLNEVKNNTEDIKDLATAVDQHLLWHINNPNSRRN
jgi:Na+-transporting methylmalonyl-CoA/oxaloacetate decarboxylase gamma subunit